MTLIDNITHAEPYHNHMCAQIVVSCTKGISVDSLETVNQILTRVLPEALHTRLAYLSGPSFAAEAGPPTLPDDRSLQVQPAMQSVALADLTMPDQWHLMLWKEVELIGGRKYWSPFLEPADILLHAQVANGNPTAVTIASKDDEVASRVQDLLSTNRFRCYRTPMSKVSLPHKAEASQRMPDAESPVNAV